MLAGRCLLLCRRTWILGVAMAVALAARAVGATSHADDAAVLIGIGRYGRLPESVSLRYPATDVIAMRALLVERFGFRPDRVVALTDEEATRAAIERAIASIPATGRALIYFSGHGATVPMSDGTDVGFLVPHDADVDIGAQEPDPRAYVMTCLRMDELREWANALPTRNVLFLADACYSGLAGGGAVAKAPRADYSRQIITAGTAGERALELRGNGVFTASVLHALASGGADAAPRDGVTSATELAAYVRRDVPTRSADGQHPQFVSFYEAGGDFQFQHLPGATPNDRPEPPSASAPPVIRYVARSQFAEWDRRHLDVTSRMERFEVVASVEHAPGPARITVSGLPPAAVWLDFGRTYFRLVVDLAQDDYQRFDIRVYDRAGAMSERSLVVQFKSSAVEAPAGMVYIPPGRFTMGSSEGDGDRDERPAHAVTLDAFYMDAREVTVGEYRRFIRESDHPSPNWKDVAKYSPGDDYPMVLVTWEDASAFATWAKKRLPTEAEWERAARGGESAGPYPWGAELASAPANSYRTAGPDAWRQGAPVASFAANAYGLHDIAGNVWEWCADWYEERYYEESDDMNPRGPASGARRVVRGGSWDDDPKYMRVAARDRISPGLAHRDLGFRCVRDAPDDPRSKDPLELNVLENVAQ